MRIVITKTPPPDADIEGAGPIKPPSTPAPQARTSRRARWAACALLALFLGLVGWSAVAVHYLSHYLSNLAFDGVWLSFTPGVTPDSIQMSMAAETTSPFPGYEAHLRSMACPLGLR